MTKSEQFKEPVIRLSKRRVFPFVRRSPLPKPPKPQEPEINIPTKEGGLYGIAAAVAILKNKK